mgnify:CR=1 FL=1
MAGISIHATSSVLGLAAIGTLVKAYLDGGGGWNGFANVPGQLYDSSGLTTTGKAFVGAVGGYTVVRAVRSSIEKQPMIAFGKKGGIRVYVL